MSGAIFNPFGQPFDQPPGSPSFERGQKVTAADLNNAAQASRDLLKAELPRQIEGRAAGEGGGGQVIEVKIRRAVATVNDATTQQEIDYFNANGAFLVVWPMVIAGPAYVPNAAAEFYCVPGGQKVVSQFRALDGSQIYDASPGDPVFFVGDANRGKTLLFGDGEKWVQEPDPADLCTP